MVEHILYVIDTLDRGGGAEASVAALASGLAGRGLTVDVATVHEGQPGFHEELRRAGVGLHSLEGPGGRAARVRRLARLLRRRRPDLVHTTLFEADLTGRTAGLLTRTPVVSSFVTLAYGEEQLRDPRFARWRVRRVQLADAVTARAVARFHAVTRQLAEEMGRRLRVPRRKIEVVPRGRDPEALGRRSPERRARARRGLGLEDGVPLILAAARGEHAKGLDVLVDAFGALARRLPDARLLISGLEGAQTPALRDAVRGAGLGGSVQLLGYRGDLPELLCAADVFALPSRREGQPGAVLEAMALEAPIVASDIPPVRETVGEEGAAVLVPPDHAGALADALEAVLRDPAAAAERTARARRRFLERFTTERVAEAMLGLYGRAVGSGDPASR